MKPIHLFLAAGRARLLPSLTAKLLPLILCVELLASPSQNLLPNGTFSGPDPLRGWRTEFPYEGPYRKNKAYLSVTSEHSPPGGQCLQIALPPGVAGGEGGKIESAFIKAEPGATYRIEIDCLPFDFSAKSFVEAWVTDPKPIPQPDKFRVPASGDHPALVMVYRAQIPDPPAQARSWQTVSREFTLPKSCNVAGTPVAPEYLSVKAFTYQATQSAGKAYFANFRLYKMRDAAP